MSAAQLALPFPAPEIQPGDTVWFTRGLRYLVATYRKGTPPEQFRPESVEPATVLDIGEPNQFGSRAYVLAVAGREHPIHAVRRWLATSPAEPCEAVMQAYGVWA